MLSITKGALDVALFFKPTCSGNTSSILYVSSMHVRVSASQDEGKGSSNGERLG